MFVDEAVVRVRAGRGGNGCVSFHREKYVPKGGPDGGDGGEGGSIYLRADHNLTSLYDLSLHPTYTAGSAVNGGGNRKNGRAGKDLTLAVPIGTDVFLDGPECRLLADISREEDTVLIARGGRGGGGNARFASAGMRLPRFALQGAPGEFLKLRLSLRLLSDLAIVGLPNCGKSTLLAALTNARPKIADYPFTTLNPNLGILQGRHGASIVLADIPGLVENAHAGRGLGNRFLKHIERARASLILLDASRDAASDFDLLRREITEFNAAIWDRPRIVAVNKLDLVKRPPLKTWTRRITGMKSKLFAISAKTGMGIESLVKNIETLCPLSPGDPSSGRVEDERPAVTINLDRDAVGVARSEKGFSIVSRQWEELASMIPRDNAEAMQWFVRKLRTDGVFRRLQLAGCETGIPVQIGPLEISNE